MNDVSLVDPSFMADPPSFTLIGDTSGGPPVDNNWTRNGEVISDGGLYSIFLAVNAVNMSNPIIFNDVTLQESHYRSTLTVNDIIPGVYMYSVNNRAMSAPRTASFTIEGIYTCTMSCCPRRACMKSCDVQYYDIMNCL